jgi:hypothetical protein
VERRATPRADSSTSQVKGSPMRDDEAHERARESAEQAGRTAEERAEKEAERLKAEALTVPMQQEVLRQLGLIA